MNIKHSLLAIALAIPMTFSSCDVLNQAGALTQADIANGLKQALTIGVNSAGNTLNASQFGNSFVMGLLPQNVQTVIGTARQLGLGSQIDKVTGLVSNAAVQSVQKSIPIFTNAISTMSITDALGILKGGNGAATNFLKSTSTNAIIAAVGPQVNNIFTSIGLKPNLLQNFNVNNPLLSGLNFNISNVLTQAITSKIFDNIAVQENNIRNNMSARTTPLLQKVFGAQSIANATGIKI